MVASVAVVAKELAPTALVMGVTSFIAKGVVVTPVMVTVFRGLRE